MPVIVVIRGGAFARGDKEGFGPFAAYMADKGLAAASIEYRASGEAIFPAAVHDTKAAVRFLRANAEEYRLDGNAIGTWGNSAGGHLALLLGTSHEIDEFEGAGGNPEISSRVQAVVSLYGTSDLYEVIQEQVLLDNIFNSIVAFLGTTIEKIPEIYKKASPIYYVDKDSAPLLLIHGASDKVIPYSQSIKMLEKYNECGAYAECRLIAGYGHGFIGGTLAYEEMDRTLAFFKKQLKTQAEE